MRHSYTGILTIDSTDQFTIKVIQQIGSSALRLCRNCIVIYKKQRGEINGNYFRSQASNECIDCKYKRTETNGCAFNFAHKEPHLKLFNLGALLCAWDKISSLEAMCMRLTIRHPIVKQLVDDEMGKCNTKCLRCHAKETASVHSNNKPETTFVEPLIIEDEDDTDIFHRVHWSFLKKTMDSLQIQKGKGFEKTIKKIYHNRKQNRLLETEIRKHLNEQEVILKNIHPDLQLI